MSTETTGWDVSRWNLKTPNLVGQSFLGIRATYGIATDESYAKHYAAARKAGVVVLAYHFGVGHKTVGAQVAAFLDVAKDADLLALDLERDKVESMTRVQAKEFIRLVHLRGRRILLYHSRSGLPSLGQDGNWVAEWNVAKPTGIAWTFHQFQGSPIDRNRFNGTPAALRKLAGLAPPMPAPNLGRARVKGAWWKYVEVGGTFTRTAHRTTAGFSGSIGEIREDHSTDGRRLGQLTTGAYRGAFLDLNDAGSVTFSAPATTKGA